MLKTGEIRTAEICGYDADGRGVCRLDGMVAFVRGAIDGETVEVRVDKVGKQQAYVSLVRVIGASVHRIMPDCPTDEKCGGCALRHMDYEEELRFKAQRVRDALVRLGGVTIEAVPILGAEQQDRYRNKAIFPVGTVGGKPDAGFFRAGSHELIAVSSCRLQSETADAVRGAVVAWMRAFGIRAYDEKTRKGLVRRVFVRTADGTGQALACLVVNGKSVPHTAELIAAVREAAPQVSTLVLNENTAPGNVVLSGEFTTLYGDGAITDTLCGLRFRLSPRSFYQVNREQAQRLYALAAERAALTKDDTLLDLYCGTGTITLVMAQHVREAIGVEIIPEAVRDAEANARENGIQNARFFCADAGTAAQKLAKEGLRPTVMVVDPPRKGVGEDVIAAAETMQPDRIVYVSCDSGTLGRDVKRLAAVGYRLVSADAVDLFPRTPHVETVVLLSRK
ncbi:MAG: 23S rRNA (uracil(1939)-C(5))-methyltransferase RlmD [Oscillospiraceae bacterium]|nr:23S rRNA (uracil(1939)-C(5))-methyltransferase RlmD [Oscillospiraceae bacterium]